MDDRLCYSLACVVFFVGGYVMGVIDGRRKERRRWQAYIAARVRVLAEKLPKGAASDPDYR
jgi:hypothetical protein